MGRHYCHNCGWHRDLPDTIHCGWCLRFFRYNGRMPHPADQWPDTEPPLPKGPPWQESVARITEQLRALP